MAQRDFINTGRDFPSPAELLPPTVPGTTPLSEWPDAAVNRLYADLTCEPGQESFNRGTVSPTSRAEARRAGSPIDTCAPWQGFRGQSDPIAVELHAMGKHTDPFAHFRDSTGPLAVAAPCKPPQATQPMAAHVDDRQRVVIEQDTPRIWEEAQREAWSSAAMLAFGVMGVIVAGAVIVFWAVLAR